jgi:nucleoside-triphosphatase
MFDLSIDYNMKVLITGLPGCGKTTLCRKVMQTLKNRYKIGGILSEEIREAGKRKGFKIIDIKTGKEGVLAHVAQKTGPRVSKYRVNLDDIKDVGVKAIEDAAETCDLVVIDEIGPMELFSEGFIDVVKYVFKGNKNILATIHYRSGHPIIDEIRHRRDVIIYKIDETNRNRILEEILRELKK